jgi:Icc-related predicted phosphoesterase
MRLLRRARRPAYRVFFATDIHGSDRCFRKFLAAASVYRANALILGGDIAGKALVPIERRPADRYEVVLHGEARTVGGDELDELAARINFNGFYPRVVEPAETERLREDAAFGEEVFRQMICAQVEDWCALAADRLDPEVRCVITPGNDDPLEVDDVLVAAERIECPEREVVPLGPFSLASLGSTNPTPWSTEREYSEQDLAAQIDAILAGHAERRLVFNFHCPPYGSRLDTAIELDAELRPVMRHGAPVEIPVGSTAVRDAIQRFAPTVALHGHIHESQGVWRHGSTVCLNPGSDYASGVLKGAIVDFDEEGGYVNHLFTSG